MKSKLGITLSWIVVFLLGAVAGVVSHFLYQQRVKPTFVRPITPLKPGSIVDGMAHYLELDAQQKESLKSIFEESRQHYSALGQKYRPVRKEMDEQYRAVRNETNEKIKQILRPDQRAKFEDFLKKVNSPPPGWRIPQPGAQKKQ
jgi:hypothetical protein